MSKILVTGAAGFIGFHVAKRLLADGHAVVGLDNLNDYYDVSLKQARLKQLEGKPEFEFVKLDLVDRAGMEALFARVQPEIVIHLAAQAGVRYAAENPYVYVSSNVTGFLHVLEGCRQHHVKHLVFASTSSIYGADTKMPFSEHQPTAHPLTLYAATKKANEMMAHSYAHLYGIPCTGLRFFTVYGPWGRPDMALFLFTKAILADEPIKVFNNGHHRRSFTYVDDIVEGIVRVMELPPARDHLWRGDVPDPATSGVAPYRLFNIGNEQTVGLMYYIELLERFLGKKGKLNMLPLQIGDVPDTEADVTSLASVVNYRPQVPVADGVKAFVDWYKIYYRVKS